MSVATTTDALNRLHRLRPRVFGADVHGFALNPPLAPADVSSFERKHNIELPRAYREFLTAIGNGGAGPFYGIFPLGQVDDNFGFRQWQENDGLIGILSEPFRLDGEWNDTSAMPTDDLALRDEAEYGRQMEAFDKVYWRSSLVNGAIPICHEGCAIRVWLVVSGPAAGSLWEDRRSEYAGIKPLHLANGSVATFGAWYAEWLNTCLTIAGDQ